MNPPLITVILPVYNGAAYLEEAMDSMVSQTWQNWELLAINDGSKDNSLEILKKYSDPRIQVIDQTNMGLAATLNKGISLAKGDYIARQDQDDVSLPGRLEEQIKFLQDHPEVGMVGCHAEIVGLKGEKIGYHLHPTGSAELKFFLLHNNPFVHSSIMFRKEVFAKTGVYSTDPSRQPPEDYEFFSRIARDWDVANIPQVLHIYREVRGSMSRDTRNPFLPKVLLISSENLAAASGKPVSDPLIRSTAAFLNGAPGGKDVSLGKVRKLLLQILHSSPSDRATERKIRRQITVLILKAMVKRWLKKNP